MADRLRSTARFAAITLAVVVVGLFVFVQVQQRLLRHRTEALFNDVREFQLHPANFSDLQRFQQRWGAHAHYDGTCTQQHCLYTVELGDAIDWIARNRNVILPHWVFRAYKFLGGRPAMVSATIGIQQNRMWRADYDLGVEVLPHDDPQYPDNDYLLGASIYYGPHLSPHESSVSAEDLNRGYRIGRPGGCEGCSIGWVYMTQHASHGDILRLSSVNLDCITRRKPCLDKMDIMPAAWSEYLPTESNSFPPIPDPSCSAPIAYYAQEAPNILTVEVLKVSPPTHDTSDPTATVRILDRLKNAGTYPTGATRVIYSDASEQYPGTPAQELVPGTRYIIFANDAAGMGNPKWIDMNRCAIVPLTDSTLAQVQTGISRDASVGVLTY